MKAPPRHFVPLIAFTCGAGFVFLAFHLYGFALQSSSALVGGASGWSTSLFWMQGRGSEHNLVLWGLFSLIWSWLNLRQFQQMHVSTTIAGLLCLLQPLILWCATSIETLALPLLAIAFWASCNSLQQRRFSRSCVSAGLMIAVFASATSVGIWCAAPILLLIILLIPAHMIRAHNLAPLFMLTAPLCALIAASAYASYVTDGQAVWLPIDSETDIATIWLDRHAGQFGTALGELLLWSVICAPALFRELGADTSVRRKKFAIFTLAVPVLAGALATDYSQASSPLPFLALLVSAQLFFSQRQSDASPTISLLCLSWIGSMIAIWYYGV